MAVADTHVLLSGGVGGAKLALGLHRLLPPGALTIIANTGDDFTHLGLAISPDIDTLMYTLGDAVNAETGWGCRDETWNFMAALEQLGGDTWFRLGDRDLATHLERTRRLAAGESLSAITQDVCRRFGIATRILPMTDAPVQTRVATEAGVLSFQDYFVRRRAEPVVTAVHYAGANEARPGAAVTEALANPRLRSLIIAPSNPWLSIDPIVSIPALRDALRMRRVPVVAVSPIVGGAAIKGPTAKIMRELKLPVSPLSIARHYRDLLDGFILDDTDAGEIAAIEDLGIAAAATQTVMRSLADKVALARFTIGFAASRKHREREIMTAAWAIVPVKSPAQAKSRLAPALDQAERATLAQLMTGDVLRALRGCPDFAGIALLTADTALLPMAREFECRILEEDPVLDLSANLQAGSRRLAADGAGTVVIVPMDLPTLEPDDVRSLLGAHQSGVTVCPAQCDGGTNALAMTPPGASDCLFGPDSANRHLDAARRRGLTASRLELPAFARDVDTVDDVIWLCGQPGGGTAREYLERSGICARLLRQERRATA